MRNLAFSHLFGIFDIARHSVSLVLIMSLFTKKGINNRPLEDTHDNGKILDPGEKNVKGHL